MLGVIGGSGLYRLGDGEFRETIVSTPFGEPSGPLLLGRIGKTDIAFLPRHGADHAHSPTNLPYRANIYALKAVGVTHVLSVSATGSMREAIAPGHLVIPDQVIDLTTSRPRTFFDGNLVAHIGLADPYCDSFRRAVIAAAASASTTTHRGGTYVCIEGPRFSTRAESNLYRSWGASVIGMTAMPEAALAREAELCYCTLALATDYDVWHDAEADVSAELVMKTLQTATADAVSVVHQLAQMGVPDCTGGCQQALDQAISANPEEIGSTERDRLGVIAARFLG